MPRWNVKTLLSLVFAAAAFAMLFFSPFGPLNSDVVPFHPMGWAGIFVFLSMLFAYSQKYEQTKSNYYFILALIFFPALLSDLYFFPIQPFFGMGMAQWMGVQAFAIFVCFAVFSKVRILRYANVMMLLLFPLAAVDYSFPNSLPWIFHVLPLLVGVVATVTLSYYGYVHKEYVLILGVVLNFMVSMTPNTYYVTHGMPIFDWTPPFVAAVTDRIAIFGRILMALPIGLVAASTTSLQPKAYAKAKKQLPPKPLRR